MDSLNIINRTLDRILPSEKEEPKVLHRAMRHSVFPGGKRIRPVIVMEAAILCGGKKRNAALVASAVELAHTYSLIHDDLPAMDNDNWRRGRPSCHKAFGEANAILAGDALLTLAFNIIAKNFASPIGLAMLRELSDAIGTKGMVGGQALDLATGQKDKEKLDNIDRLKTGKLFEVSAKLGAISGHGTKKQILSLTKYGACLGAAFQIADDIADGERYKSVAEKKRAGGECARLIKHAKGALKIFGKKANRLKIIADKVSQQTKV